MRTAHVDISEAELTDLFRYGLALCRILQRGTPIKAYV